MLAAWWLAVIGLPVYLQPLPEAPDVPAAVAVASGQVSMRQPCYRLACADAEWAVAPGAGGWHPAAAAPGAVQRIASQRLPRLATRRFIGLYSPARRRDWFHSRGNSALVDTRYGLEAVRAPQTRLDLEFGTGYRLEPYSGYGTATQGPVALGQMRLSQRFGERAEFNQQMRVEKGRENAYIRQTIGVDLALDPQWSLLGDFELRHDTAGNGGEGRTDREGSLRLRYAF
ncbi:MAG: DUF481 domain-containing protein [Luteimonas sp.]|nr:DUF481 domain-containing protein [Luteimonas sp.]